jgi:hypothetical protein
MSSAEEHYGGDEVYGCEEVTLRFVVAGGDGAVLLEPIEEVLDEIARAVRWRLDGMTATFPASRSTASTRASAS